MRRLVLLLGLACSVGALAQAAPPRPIRVIVPFAPGSEADRAARPFADKLSTMLGEEVTVENRIGDGGDDAASYVAHRPADGRILLFGGNFLATRRAAVKSPLYDPLKDLAPVSMVAVTATAMAVNPRLPSKDFHDLATLSKEKPLTFATQGIASVAHLAAELLNQQGATRLVHVPRQSVHAAVNDTVAGKTDVVIASLRALAPLIETGKLRGIAILGPKPSPILRKLPTIVEAGGPAVDADLWYGLFVRAGTPSDIVQRLNAATVKAIESQDLVARMRKAGYEPQWSRPDVLENRLKSDLAQWSGVAAANIPAD